MSRPSSRQYFTAASHESGRFCEKFPAYPSPAATMSAVVPAAEGILGSAPPATRARIAGTSVPCAARQNGVVPTVLIHC